ncbi:hypothetical protein V8F06_007031, partial [Rhypophila decipiens]
MADSSENETFWQQVRRTADETSEYDIIAKLVNQPKLPIQAVVDELIKETQKALKDHESDPEASKVKDWHLVFDIDPYSPLTGHVARTWFALFKLVRVSPERKHKRLIHFVRKLKQTSLETPSSIKEQLCTNHDHPELVLWASLPLLQDVVGWDIRSHRLTYTTSNPDKDKLAELERLVSFHAKLTSLAPPRPHPWLDHEVPDDLATFGLEMFLSATIGKIRNPPKGRERSHCLVRKNKYLDHCTCEDSRDLIAGPPSEALLRCTCLWLGHCAERFWEIAVATTNHWAEEGEDPNDGWWTYSAIIVANWEKWREAVKDVLWAERNGHVSDFIMAVAGEYLSEDTFSLLEETIESMNRAKSQGPQPLKIDWKANFKTEDELEADAKIADKGAHLHWEEYPSHAYTEDDRVYYEHDEKNPRSVHIEEEGTKN